MQKLMIGIALLFMMSASAFAQQEAQETSTRFGSLSVGEDKILMFKGHKLHPEIEGNNSLDLGKPFRIGATDVVLVTDIGGTACPALYYFITVSNSGAKASALFGSCSDLTKVKRTGDAIYVSMPGFTGPYEPKRAQRKAASERHVFIYRAGVITDNGKRVKNKE